MIQMSNLLTGVAALGLLTLTAMACRADGAMDESTNAFPTASEIPLFQPFTVGVEAGTTGIGGAADWRFANHFGIGGAFDYFPYSYDGTIEGVPFNVKLRLESAPLTLNLYPFKHSSFHLSAGVLLNDNHLSGSANIPGSKPITIGNDTSYSGPVSMSIKQEFVDPYLTLGGNLYFDRGHHVSLGGQLGVIYTGEPDVDFSSEAGAANNQIEKNKINHYAKNVQFWPVIKISLNYSF